MWSAYVVHDGRRTFVAQFGNRRKAFKEVKKWLNDGWVPIHTEDSRETLVPTGSIKQIEIEDDDAIG